MRSFYFATRKLQLVPAATILVALAISIPLSAQTITTFDAPGAGTGPFQGTYPFNVDPSGTIIGRTLDAGNVRHGFIRSPQGSYTIFDAPGAGTGPFQGTFPVSPLIINPNGAIAGYYTDSSDVSHGFLRDKNGAITTFDVPGAGTGAGEGTFSYAISPTGAITGFYFDGADVSHGFLRDENGVITTFDVPGSGTDAFEGTYGGGFTPNGTIMGNYFTPDTLSHGFLRNTDGTFVTFDAPDAGNVPGSLQGPYPFGIAPNGAVTGFSYDANNVVHGFVREADGGVLSLPQFAGQ